MSSQRKNFYAYLSLFLFALLLRSLYLLEIKDVGAFSLLLGAALIEERRFEEALPVLQRAVKINPNLVKARYNLEVVQSQMRASQTGLQHLSDARRLKPNGAP